MPYSNISELPKNVKKLSKAKQKIFLAVFNKAYEKYKDEKKAFAIAYGAVNHSNVTKHKVISRSQNIDADFFFDAILSSTSVNYDGLSISDEVLKSISISNLGDYNHKSIKTNNSSLKGLFKAVKAVYDQGKIFIRFVANKFHENYHEIEQYVENEYELDMSAEIIDPVIENNTVVGAKQLGWTVLINEEPANSDSKVYLKHKGN